MWPSQKRLTSIPIYKGSKDLQSHFQSEDVTKILKHIGQNPDEVISAMSRFSSKEVAILESLLSGFVETVRTFDSKQQLQFERIMQNRKYFTKKMRLLIEEVTMIEVLNRAEYRGSKGGDLETVFSAVGNLFSAITNLALNNFAASAGVASFGVMCLLWPNTPFEIYTILLFQYQSIAMMITGMGPTPYGYLGAVVGAASAIPTWVGGALLAKRLMNKSTEQDEMQEIDKNERGKAQR